MTSYSVEFKPSARKELDSLSDPLSMRIIEKIDTLSHTPRPSGCKQLKGYKDLWRIRIGDWRVIYIIDDKAKLISIASIAHRSEAYD